MQIICYDMDEIIACLGKFHSRAGIIQGESKKTDAFDIQMNNKGVSFF